MRQRWLNGWGLLLTGGVLMVAAWTFPTMNRQVPEWADQVIRLHVVANSDSWKDQAIKRAVRDAILDEVTPLFIGTKTVEEAQEAIRQAEPQIREAALRVLRQYGVSYGVALEMGRFAFPDRVYGRVFLPAGEYNALRVKLGKGRGANWWCVLFPPLCFVDWSTGVVLEPKPGTDGKETVTVSRREVRALLDEEEAEKMPVRIRSVAWDWLTRRIGGRSAKGATTDSALPHTVLGKGGETGMAFTKASDLRKEVIDIRTGRRLGELIDVEIDDETGRITAIVVPGEAKFFGFVGSGPDLVIPWSKIKRIGPDCILVELDSPASSG
ncbi:MAG TPA: stage II sporulation protein R [Symbiobacteriaceae bacterium]